MNSCLRDGAFPGVGVWGFGGVRVEGCEMVWGVKDRLLGILAFFPMCTLHTHSHSHSEQQTGFYFT
jgi:hypothetical protein